MSIRIFDVIGQLPVGYSILTFIFNDIFRTMLKLTVCGKSIHGILQYIHDIIETLVQ